jgi:Zn-dependent metalloprotease
MRRSIAIVWSSVVTGFAAFLAGLAATWLALGILAGQGGVLGLAGSRLAGSVHGTLTALGAAMGAPLTVRVVGVELQMQRPSPSGISLVILAGPVLASIVVGWLAVRTAAWQRVSPWITVPTAAAAFALEASASLALVGSPDTRVIDYGVSGSAVSGLALAWSLLLGGTVAWWLRRFARPAASPARATNRRRRRAFVTAVAVVASLLVPTESMAAPPPTPEARGYWRPGVTQALARLRATSPSTWRVAVDPHRGVPSTVAMRSPLRTDVTSWLRSNSALFGFRDVTTALRQTLDGRDDLGWRHIWFQQVVDGVAVEYANLGVHLDPSGQYVTMVSNGLRPDLSPDRSPVTNGRDAAQGLAARALPTGRLVREPSLVMLPLSMPTPGHDVRAIPVWRVWLLDDDVALSTEYLVAATGPQRVVRTRNRAHDALNRRVYDLEHKENDSGGVLRRSEGGQPSTIGDVNDGYDRTGDTYRYLNNVLSRDSFDGQGTTMTVKVQWRKNYENAHWTGGGASGFTVFGDDMTKLDVVTHEWFHAVTEAVFTANTGDDLQYIRESGALNESISDSFAEAAEASESGGADWLLGEDTKYGPIRSMVDPKKYGQPAHMRDYKAKCELDDAGGVHTNSGIPNHAFFLISDAYGIQVGANILWHTISGGQFGLLAATPSFADFRIQQIAAAENIYGRNSDQAQVVATAWSAVGVEDDTVAPVTNRCTCAVNTSLGIANDGTGGSPAAQELYLDLHDLLAVADTDASAALSHYAAAFLASSDRMSELMRANSALRQQFSNLLFALHPISDSLVAQTNPATVITAGQVAQANAMFDALAAADRAAGGHALADLIDTERARVNLNQLAGLDAIQAREYLDTFFAAS